MPRNIVVSFLQGVLTAIVRIARVTLIGVGVRLLMMLTVQQRGNTLTDGSTNDLGR